MVIRPPRGYAAEPDAGERSRIGSGAVWEERFGAIRGPSKAGPLIFVSGTTAADPTGGPPIGGDDIAAQARECFRRIEVALGELGSGLGEVVRTRMFVTDIGLSRSGRAGPRRDLRQAGTGGDHGRGLGLISPKTCLLVEIEVDAVSSSD